MKLTETVITTPNMVNKSVRRKEWRCLTSGPAGKIIPLAYAPVLREDRVSRGRARIQVEMAETAETLLNGVRVAVYVHFVPHLAYERFNGMDALNRSYRGEPEIEGGDVIPYFREVNYSATSEINRTLGLHAIQGEKVNAGIAEAYNVVVNERRKARSNKLPVRSEINHDLARAFWFNPTHAHIVPDFDDAMVDGEVELTLSGNLPVTGLYGDANATVDTVIGPDGAIISGENRRRAYVLDDDTTDTNGFQPVFAEMEAAGVKLSLANIEAAKQTAAWAALRKRFDGHDDDYIVDLLMNGIRVPDAQLARPILLDKKTTLVGYSKRHATDGDSLDKSVTTGETFVDVNFVTPPMNTGGLVLVTMEIVPEQMFERQEEPYFHLSDVAQLPEYERDYLDPQKVELVENRFIDVQHTDPDGTFGYAPLNHKWKASQPNIGGKYFRETGDPFDENRQKLWINETVDPTLTEDFYLVGELHHNVFADTQSDAFEITTLGFVETVGNTVFGKGLQEDSDDYEKVAANVDHTRIDQDA